LFRSRKWLRIRASEPCMHLRLRFPICGIRYAIFVIPYERAFLCVFSLMLKTWQYNRNIDTKIAKTKPTDHDIIIWCVCRGRDQLLPQNRFTHYKIPPKILIKLLLKQYHVKALECLFSNMLKIWTTIRCGEIRTILHVDQRI